MPRRSLLALFVVTLAVFVAGAQQSTAPNLTGTWTGFLTNDADSSDRDAAVFVLKQAGAELTGSGGPNENQQWALQKGKVATSKEGTTATFVVATDDMTMEFDLKLVEGRLKGTVRAQRGEQKRSGTVDLERSTVTK